MTNVRKIHSDNWIGAATRSMRPIWWTGKHQLVKRKIQYRKGTSTRQTSTIAYHAYRNDDKRWNERNGSKVFVQKTFQNIHGNGENVDILCWKCDNESPPPRFANEPSSHCKQAKMCERNWKSGVVCCVERLLCGSLERTSFTDSCIRRYGFVVCKVFDAFIQQANVQSECRMKRIWNNPWIIWKMLSYEKENTLTHSQVMRELFVLRNIWYASHTSSSVQVKLQGCSRLKTEYYYL